jgi:predicted RNase H-like nuclease (RuvC/YqgF family)
MHKSQPLTSSLGLQGEQLTAAKVDKAELAAEIERLKSEGSSLQSKLLRKDFDMTHTRALKAILETRVEDLERQIAERNAWVGAREARVKDLERQIAEQTGWVGTRVCCKVLDLHRSIWFRAKVSMLQKSVVGFGFDAWCEAKRSAALWRWSAEGATELKECVL